MNNRKIILAIIDAIKLCGRLGIALRGHRDASKYHPEIGHAPTSAGVGNFVHIINYAIRNGNKVLENHLKTRSKRETYLSATIQSNLLKCCYQVINESLIKEVKASKIFALILDEASDISNKEQLSFCLRFVDSSNDIREEFLKSIHCDVGVTSRDFFEAVTNTLSEFGLDLMNCRGQGYDGAGGMAGKVNGLSGIVLQSNKLALYTHCHSHRLNLVVSSLTRIIGFRNVMDAIKAISYFFNLSPKRQEHLEKVIKENFPEVTRKKLLHLCRTRWLERIDGVDLFEDLFLAILMTLEEIFFNLEGKYNKGTSVKANSLLKLIFNFDFIVKLVISRHILHYTNFVTQILQGKNNDITKGVDLINTLPNIFELVRNDIDNRHNKWYQKALALATAAHRSESKPRTCFKMSVKENYPSDTTSESYKMSFTIAVVDEVYGQLNRRFTGDNSIVFEGLFQI